MKFIAFRTLIENEIGNPNTADASSTRMRQLILQWTQTIYQEIGRRGNWSWLEGLVGNATLAIGVKEVTIPSTIARYLDIMDLSQLPPLPLDFIVEHQYWDGQYEIADTGVPEYFHVWKGILYFDKAPESVWTYQYRFIGRVAVLNTTDNGGLGTEILLPDAENDLLYDGVLAYAYRYKKDQRFQIQWSLYQQKLEKVLANDRRGPGFFYPEKTKERARDITTFRVIVP